MRLAQSFARVTDLGRPHVPGHLFVPLANPIRPALFDRGLDAIDRNWLNLIRQAFQRANRVGMQLLVSDRECPPTVQPTIRLGNLLPESLGEILENVFVVEWLAVQCVAWTGSVPTETSCRSLLFPEVRRDEGIIGIADDSDVMRGDRVNHVAEPMLKSRVVVKHASIGKSARCGEGRERLRARRRGMPTRSRPLQFVDRRQ